MLQTFLVERYTFYVEYFDFFGKLALSETPGSEAKNKDTTKAPFARTRSRTGPTWWMRAWSSKAEDRLFDPKTQKPESETRATRKKVINHEGWDRN